MHVYKHLHGISLRQTGISCKNTATWCHSNVLFIMFDFSFLKTFIFERHSISHTATPLPLVSNSTYQPSASLSPSHLSLLATHFGFLRNAYLSTMLWCLTYNFNLSNRTESTDCVLKTNTFTKSISILVIDWPGLSRSPNSTIYRVNLKYILSIFSHSWTWHQKQATGGYQNNWSIDSVSSQQNLQSFDHFMHQIFNILLYLISLLLT